MCSFDGIAEFATKYKDLAIVIGWGLTVYGWQQNAKAASDRDKRKEVRSEVDSCIELADEILSLAREYYSDSDHKDDEARAAKIRFYLRRLIARVERLHDGHSKIDAVDAAGVMLDAISGQDFDSKDRSLLGPSSERMQSMEMSVHEIIDSLEAGFQNAFTD